ncbi:MAG: hypothetical protein IT558_03950 [Alphaproteobacteria bacterium]|nr:hypothetical protein [Alphaproteobacteria bacterium]
MSARFRSAPDSSFDLFDSLVPFALPFNIIYTVLDALLLCCLAVGWMRAITRGVSDKNKCSALEEWKLVLCCIAQMFGINIVWFLLTMSCLFLCFGLWYVLSLILPAALIEVLTITFSTIPSFLTAILVLSCFPLVFLSSSFLYFPAKANGFVISSNLGRNLFKGLSLRFLASTALALLPLGLLLGLYFVGVSFLHDFSGSEAFYIFNVLLVFFIAVFNLLTALIFCGVLSGYYLWVRENRMETSLRKSTTVPDDPFSDEGWDGPMWEDFR